jgi:YebC/PmpR family DNA-binding regulatory protein
MARHSHWAQIKLKKGALDKKRGKIFSRHSRLIEISVRNAGGDPTTNAGLRLVMENARADNMPRENIDRAIKKGMGELKEGEQMQEATYEAFGPGGIAMLIETLTNNKNRTNQMVRRAVEDHGGKIGAMGSVSFMFDKKGEIKVASKSDKDNDELELIDAGAEDIEGTGDWGQGTGQENQESGFVVYTSANALFEVKKKIEEKGFKVEFAELKFIPKNYVEVDQQTAEKIYALMEALEEEEDVTNVAANFEVA